MFTNSWLASAPKKVPVLPTARGEMLIPRIFHRVWLGPDPLPEEFRAYGESWERHHPHWEMRLWTDEDIAELDPPEGFRRGRTPAERAEVLRLELVRRFGGVHVDTDVECLRPIDPLLEGVRAFAAYDSPAKKIINGAVMGAVPGYPTIERTLREVLDTVGKGDLADAGALLTPNFADDPDVVVFGYELFHPYRFWETSRRGEEFPNAYAVHHWSRLWMTPEHFKRRLQSVKVRLNRTASALEQERARGRKLSERLRIAEDRLARSERRLSALERSRYLKLRRRLRRALHRARRTLKGN